MALIADQPNSCHNYLLKQ